MFSRDRDFIRDSSDRVFFGSLDRGESCRGWLLGAGAGAGAGGGAGGGVLGPGGEARGGVLGADELHEVLLEAGAGEVGGVTAGRVPGHLLLHTGHLAQHSA